MNVGERAVQQGSLPRSGRRPRTNDRTRKCHESECDTVLSRYNLGDACSVHAPLRFPRVRGRVFARDEGVA